MLKKIEVENLRSIGKKIELSFEKGKNKQYEENIIQNTNLLKTIFIYGSNNSGKSNVLKGIKFLKDIVEKGKNIFDGEYLPNVFLKEKKENSTLKYYFEFENKAFFYEVKINFLEKKIIKEILKVNEEFIYKRQGKYVETKELTYEIDEDIFYLTFQYSKEGGNTYIRTLYEYIENIIYIDQQRKLSDKNLQLKKLKNHKNDINKIIKQFGFDFELLPYKIDNGISIKEELGVKKHNLTLALDFLESFGTNVFINLLLDIEYTESNFIVIDEIERGLHFALVIEFIKYINNKYPNKQLLIATHMTDILGIESKIRKDQIYISSLNNDESFIERAFNKRAIRETMNFQKIYKSNSLGGNPIFKKEDDLNG